MAELERREFDKYFDKMVQMIELNSSGQEKFSSHIDTLTRPVETLINEIKTNEDLLREILDKMKETSNATLNIELQKIKDINTQLQITSIQLLQEMKDFCDNDNGVIIKEKLDAMDAKITGIEKKDKNIGLFMKIIAGIITVIGSIFLIIIKTK